MHSSQELTLKFMPSAMNPDAAEKSASQLLSVVLTAIEFMAGVSKRYCPGVLVVRTVTVWKRAKFCMGCAPAIGMVTILKGGGACCVRATMPSFGGPPGRDEAATLMLLGAAWSRVCTLKPISRASLRKTLWGRQDRTGHGNTISMCHKPAACGLLCCACSLQAGTACVSCMVAQLYCCNLVPRNTNPAEAVLSISPLQCARCWPNFKT